jgi:hypothetical protein
MKRCSWCGKFVSEDTEPSVWTVRGVVDGVSDWRTFSQTLCPEDAAFWCRENAWSRKPTPEEAANAIPA